MLELDYSRPAVKVPRKRPQTIFRIMRRDVPHTILPNALLRDDRLTMEQRGVLVYILSYPDNWEFSFTWLRKAAKIGKNKAYEVIGALEQLGYCAREQQRFDDGTLAGTVFTFTDEPIEKALDSPCPGIRDTAPSPGLRETGLPGTGSRPHKRNSKLKETSEVKIPALLRSEQDAEGKRAKVKKLVEPAAPASVGAALKYRVEGYGLPADDMAARAEREAPRAPSARFIRLARDELCRRLPGIGNGLAEAAVKGMAGPSQTVMTLLVQAAGR